MRRVTLSDVAEAAAVSVATASRALHGGPRVVGEEHRRRVLDAAERLGYQADLLAQATSKGSTPTVALVVSDIRDPLFATIARGVIDRSAEAGLIVTISNVGATGERGDELATLRSLRGQAPRVTMLAAGGLHSSAERRQLVATLRALETGNGRVVVVGRENLPFDTVTIDDRGGARSLATRVAELGYRAPLLVGGRMNLEVAVRREEGIRRGLTAAGLPLPPSDVIRCDFTRDGAYDALVRLGRERLARYDVILCGSDVMAVGAMTALRESGLRPGADVGVTGFGDVPAALDVRPQLTTVRVPLRQIGVSAVELALSPPASAPRMVAYEPAVLVRSSTPPRA